MAATKQIPRDQWKDYFDRFTKTLVRDGRQESATIELISPGLGDQIEVDAAHLFGISYDPRSGILEVLLDRVDRLVYQPEELWVVEEEDDLVSSLEIVRDGGMKEILTFRRTSPPALRQ
jgi:Family of unknown function (DUF5335)